MFAELTTNNPNVWFELGYSLAKNKPFCMVCADEREGAYPFDVRMLKILSYKTGSKSDYLKIEASVTQRLEAITGHGVTPIALVSPPSVPSTVAGLSDLERGTLAFVLEEHLSGGQSVYMLQSNMERIGYTKAAATLAVLSLRQKRLVEVRDAENYNGETYSAVFLTDGGISWFDANSDKLVIKSVTISPKAPDDFSF